jgi:hypothetical protein
LWTDENLSRKVFRISSPNPKGFPLHGGSQREEDVMQEPLLTDFEGIRRLPELNEDENRELVYPWQNAGAWR